MLKNVKISNSPQTIGIICIVVLVLSLAGYFFQRSINTPSKPDNNSLSLVENPPSSKPADAKTSDRKELFYKEAEKFKYLDQEFNSFVFDIEKHDISFLFNTESGNRLKTISNVHKTIEKSGKDLRFVMNAGIFLENGEPEGLYINEGEVIAELNLNDGKGNFYLKPNGVFFIDKNKQVGILESEEFANKEIIVNYATQSGPLLIQNGKLHPKINKGSPNLRIRNGVGIISPTKAVFVLSEKPVNFYDFAMTFKERFECTDALYLDGVISQIYLPEVGRDTSNKTEFSGMIAVTDKQKTIPQ